MEAKEKISLPIPRQWLGRIQWLVRLAAIFYVVSATLLLALIKIFGERHWLCSGFLYLPPTVWLLPPLFFLPLFLFWQRKLGWMCAAFIFGVLFFYMDCHWGFQATTTAPTLTLLTNNIGQRSPRTLQAFLAVEQPDVIALQDTWGRARELSRQHPGRFVATQAQFALISKYEIKNAGVVPGLNSIFGPVAAWFEINYHGQTVVVYNVHLPTPRTDFERLRGQGFLREAARRGGIYSAEARAAYQKSMADRVQMAEKLADWLRREKRPFLVAGDFNAPSAGQVYRLFVSEWTDAFAAKGRGYGLTFPGRTWNPLSLFGPWLRIDYIFAGKNWRPIYTRVEPRQPAQHLAVVARFEFNARP